MGPSDQFFYIHTDLSSNRFINLFIFMKKIVYSSIYYLIYGQNVGSTPIAAAPAAISKGLVGIHPLKAEQKLEMMNI
jgi:hypothetical protein